MKEVQVIHTWLGYWLGHRCAMTFKILYELYLKNHKVLELMWGRREGVGVQCDSVALI